MHIWGSVLVTDLCPTLCNPMDLPGSSVCGILQEKILEWVDIPLSKGSSWPRTQIRVSCIAGRYFFTVWATREVLIWGSGLLQKMPQRHMDYSELKLLEKQLVQEEDSDPSFCPPWNQEMNLSCERHSPCTRTQRDILITRGRVFRAKKPIQTNIVISLLI